nr:MAG TPA: hypothetical protein [Caudoviricetes sp.]
MISSYFCCCYNNTIHAVRCGNYHSSRIKCVTSKIARFIRGSGYFNFYKRKRASTFSTLLS